MRLYKRGEYWWVSFPYQGETVRRSTRCTTRTAALLTAQRWERERADPDHAAAASATFGGAVTAFLADLERSDKPQATRQFYKRKAGTLVRILGADRPLSEVNAQLVDKYIATREAEPVAFDALGFPKRHVSANTIHKELVTLRQVLKRAKRRGEFRRDVSEVLPVGFSPRYMPRNVSLTFAEAERLLATLKPARAAAVAFALATTARRAEVFRCWRGDVHGGLVDLRGTKTEGSYRTVTVPAFAEPLIAFAIAHGDGKDGLLFRPWPNAIRGLASACRRAKCPRVTWNDLRRTLSTWLVEGGVSDTVIAKMLGHVDTTMLHRVYGKPRQDAMGALLTEQSKAIPALTIAIDSGAKPSGAWLGSGSPRRLQRCSPEGTDSKSASAAVLGGERGPENKRQARGQHPGDRARSRSSAAASDQGIPNDQVQEERAGERIAPSNRRGDGQGHVESDLPAAQQTAQIAVRPAYASADDQELPQPIATSEQDENHLENSGNSVGPVGVEPTTKGLKGLKSNACMDSYFESRWWTGPIPKGGGVRAVDVHEETERIRAQVRAINNELLVESWRAVDVQQTSEGRPTGSAFPPGGLAPQAGRGSEEPAPTSGGDGVGAPVPDPAEGAGSPEEPPVFCIACSVGDECPMHATSAWTGRREPGSAGAAEAEEPPLSCALCAADVPHPDAECPAYLSLYASGPASNGLPDGPHGNTGPGGNSAAARSDHPLSSGPNLPVESGPGAQRESAPSTPSCSAHAARRSKR